MLNAVEVLAGARRSMRRGVRMECEVLAGAWEGARRHRVLDLSHEGMRVAAGTTLPIDEGVIVSFTPPGWWLTKELTVMARVARALPRGDEPASMGLEFLDLSAGEEQALAQTLIGRPPPLPRVRTRLRRELVWVDMLVTYEEELDDRVNVFEVSELIGLERDFTIEPRALGGLLTGGKRPYQWRGAA
jgi:hypothetical protein